MKNEKGEDVEQTGFKLNIDPEKERREIVAGWYCTEDGKTTSVAHWLDEDDFRTNGGVMNHETIDSITKRKETFHCRLYRFRLVTD